HGAEKHLASCEGCRASFDQLRRVMETIDAAPVPEPGPSFERTVWARLAPAIDAQPRRAAWLGWFSGPRLALVGGLAAVLLAVGVVRYTADRMPADDITSARAADALRESVMLTAVSDHIEQSQVVLVELANADARGGDLDVSLERVTADELVSSGRLYRETARQTGDLQLASLLDDLELVLVDIARGPEALSSEQLEEIRNQIEEQGLIFKLRVLAAEVKARQDSARPTQPAVPGTSKRTL
ncbi:MAG: hypothetical protein M3R55_12230, partial [Acidobacteriota bacterium]|nr:hypothetical protein [Acidobacteriota bacterium]